MVEASHQQQYDQQFMQQQQQDMGAQGYDNQGYMGEQQEEGMCFYTLRLLKVIKFVTSNILFRKKMAVGIPID